MLRFPETLEELTGVKDLLRTNQGLGVHSTDNQVGSLMRGSMVMHRLGPAAVLGPPGLQPVVLGIEFRALHIHTIDLVYFPGSSRFY